ncbi:uncharacterized protein Z519_09000 [Cladophialophora bantiana CBS 173.52]|uniref:DUF3669 domain-containing protein n=1 Tax=Cladophialophora bantiana (strain ATCC 10958 / CBS 173.52 / CDC B-1940 / NIH 8579) TaxID=1442370 RepID=A0A0D2HHT1_CLAB1|nr:uncharacterized protein Z519_09000 [Cladophialophora bantiana CBS 173.52]KIW90355.1 hypothetical protein Z519_09000 [Cladophialophora bantiana CBS 173.52]
MPQFKGCSEESISTTLSEGLMRLLVLEDLLDKQLAHDILKRALSAGSKQSTSSSLAGRMNAVRFDSVNHLGLRDIGYGSCGSVFEIPGSAKAIKKGANCHAIFKDFHLTGRAYNSYLIWAGLFRDGFPERRTPRVPRAHTFHGPEAREFWTAILSRFPKGDQTKDAVFYVERILSVPELTREALIRQFYQEDRQIQHDVFSNLPNKDCLARVYIDANNPNTSLYNSSDTLRNFPLYLDQAKMIGLDVNAFAEEMAMGLAILHWQAQIDAQDTEFVIGSSTSKGFSLEYLGDEPTEIPVSSGDDFTQRETHLWMLDYDKCSNIDLDSEDPSSEVVRKCLVAVTGNDPYFPHPHLDPDLWRRFRKAYLKASEIIIRTRQRRLKRHVAKLPAMFLEQWEQWGDEDMEAEGFDPFERNSADQEESESEADDSEEDDEDNSEDEEEDTGEDGEE